MSIRNKGNQLINQLFSRIGPWSANSELGQKQRFDPGEDNRQTILKMSEWGFPSTWCVSLGMKYNTDPAVMNFRITAEVLFGSGGSTNTVKVDWHNGTQFTVCGNAIEVSAFYAPALPDDIIGPNLIVPPDLELSVLLSRYPSGSGVLPTITEFFTSAGNPGGIAPSSTSNSVRVPNFATNFQLLPMNEDARDILYTTPGDIQIVFSKRNDVTGVIGQFNSTDLAALPYNNGFPIPNGTRNIFIINNTLETVRVLGQFGLHL